jgi:hypothetical protein
LAKANTRYWLSIIDMPVSDEFAWEVSDSPINPGFQVTSVDPVFGPWVPDAADNVAFQVGIDPVEVSDSPEPSSVILTCDRRWIDDVCGKATKWPVVWISLIPSVKTAVYARGHHIGKDRYFAHDNRARTAVKKAQAAFDDHLSAHRCSSVARWRTHEEEDHWYFHDNAIVSAACRVSVGGRTV